MLEHPDHRVRVAAVEAAARLETQQAAAALVQLLKDPMWDVRRAAAAALGKIPDPQAIGGLLTALGDSDADVREAAAVSLGRIGDLRGVGGLVLALVDRESNVRHAAAPALQQIRFKWSQTEEARRMIPDLRAAFNSGDPAVRYAASSVLQQLGAATGQRGALDQGTSVMTAAGQKQRNVLSAFTEFLADPDRDIRLAAAETLGRLGDQRSASALMTALSDSDEDVRRAAAKSLEFLHFLGAA
jgi:hypothetical protein